MGEWTWLHALFPLADIELVSAPIDARSANVLVRTVRRLPDEDAAGRYEVRVAPHNVAPFRGGPWLRAFAEQELEQPGEAIAQFRQALADEVRKARSGIGT